MPCVFHDGYTLVGTIPAQRGIWDEIRFKYRPALPEKVFGYTEAPKNSGKAALNAVVALLKDQLIEWDAAGPDGNILPLTEDVLRRTAKPVLDKLVDAVCGYMASEAATDAKN